ncbi:hypothetical protein [Mycetocola saprophilus]|uniref:hypothetical protein n=1 Tax=Mycetocola saprophilus TaxID=76636 RepID=UPI003BF0C22A
MIWMILMYVLTAAVLLTILGVLFWPGKRSDPDALTLRRVVVTRVIGQLTVGFALLGAVAGVGRTLWLSETRVELPGSTSFPEIDAGAGVNGLRILWGGFDHASFTMEGVDLWGRFWLAVDGALIAALFVTAGFAVVRICDALLAGTPFQVRVVRWLRITAWVSLGAGLGAQLANYFARHLIAGQLEDALPGRVLNAENPGTLSGQFLASSQAFTPDFWPVGLWLVLLALAAVFGIGARLQRENRGLRREVEGLV